MAIRIPKRLQEACSRIPDRQEWVRRLPDVVSELAARWSLTLEDPLENKEISIAWVAPAVRGDGARAVLKLGVPHMEALHEIDGLRFWNGNPTAHLLEADDGFNAMLLERCLPGTHLRDLPEPEQDAVMADLMPRLWRVPPMPHPFRPLSEMTAN